MGNRTALLIALVLTASLGCSKIVGFKDVSVEGGGDDGATDGSVDGSMPKDAPPKDAPPDMGPAPKLWVFTTSAGMPGGFGVTNGARTTADIKCQDMYNANFTSRNCTLANVHAVIQVDDVSDTLARMDINFPIPQASEVQRATDATVVIDTWDQLINPNAMLGAPVSTSGSPVRFWSGRGLAGNLSCTNWTSSVTGTFGNIGDATQVTGWMTTANQQCSNIDQHLLCICW